MAVGDFSWFVLRRETTNNTRHNDDNAEPVTMSWSYHLYTACTGKRTITVKIGVRSYCPAKRSIDPIMKVTLHGLELPLPKSMVRLWRHAIFPSPVSITPRQLGSWTRYWLRSAMHRWQFGTVVRVCSSGRRWLVVLDGSDNTTKCIVTTKTETLPYRPSYHKATRTKVFLEKQIIENLPRHNYSQIKCHQSHRNEIAVAAFNIARKRPACNSSTQLFVLT